MTNDEGIAVNTQTVAAIGGKEGRTTMSPEAQTVQIVSGGHISDSMRAEGVTYPENPGVGPFPEGTRMGDSTPGDEVN